MPILCPRLTCMRSISRSHKSMWLARTRRDRCGACRLLAVAVLMEVMLLMVMREREYDLPDKNIHVIYKVGMCLIIFAVVDLCKTLSCRLLSLRVNAESMFENLQVRRQPPRIASGLGYCLRSCHTHVLMR